MRTRLATLLCVAAMVVMALGPAVAVAVGPQTWLVNGAYDDNDQCISAVRHCKTIQAAVTAAAADDTILVAAGTYDEQVVIDGKSLTIGGAGDATVVKPSSPAKLTSLYTYPALPIWAGQVSAAVVVVKNVGGTGVTFQNLKVDGASIVSLPAGAGRIAGIQYGESAGKIKNVTVASVHTTGYNDRATGIDLSSVAAVTIEVADSRVSDSARNSIQAIGGSIAVNIHGNSVVGPSTNGPNVVPNGIVLLYGVTGSVAGNKVEALHYIHGDESESAGIMVYGTGSGLTIEANEVFNVDSGIGVAASANNAVIKSNYLHNNVVGLSFEDGAANNQAFGNTITGNTEGLQIIGAGMPGCPVGGDWWCTPPGVGNSAYSNNISGNTTNAISYDATKSFGATGNWWGSSSGPGTVAYVTTIPFAKALAASTTASTHEIGQEGTLDTHVTVTGLYGAQLRVSHDAKLTFASGTANAVGLVWAWDKLVESFVAVTGGERVSGSMQRDLHPAAANLTGESIATWRYACALPGVGVLSYDTTEGLGTILSDKDGFAIASALTGDSITCMAATASANGTIGLQGRVQSAATPAGWNGAVVVLTCTGGTCSGYGPYVLTSDINGAYQLVKSGPGNGIALGTYSASVSRRAYLGANKATNVVIAAGTTTIPAPSPALLGGDVDGSGVIDITDLSNIGAAFGLTITADTGADVNGDGVVNILDLVLGGGNFGLTSSTWS